MKKLEDPFWRTLRELIRKSWWKNEVSSMLTDLDSSLMPQIPEILEEVGGEDRIIEFVELLGWWATADKEGGLYAKVAMRIATSKLKQGLSLFIDSAMEKRWKACDKKQLRVCVDGYAKTLRALAAWKAEQLAAARSRVGKRGAVVQAEAATRRGAVAQ